MTRRTSKKHFAMESERGYFQPQGNLVQSLKEEYGLHNIREEWIRRQAALSLEIVKGPICRTNLCEMSTGTLPWNVLEAHSVQLGIKVLVQIEDVINIANANPRSHEAPRVLQMTLNDGAIDFVAVELQPLGGRISMKTIPGTKIMLLPSTLVQRGRLLLTASDFTFFGSPSANLWGDGFDSQIAEALKDAGLPNPNASSFDSIARSQHGTSTRSHIPVDMGGIADAIPALDGNNEDGDEDMFWAQAVEMMDRTLPDSRISSALEAPPTENLLPSENIRNEPIAEESVLQRNEVEIVDLIIASQDRHDLETAERCRVGQMDTDSATPRLTMNCSDMEDRRPEENANQASDIANIAEIPGAPLFDSDSEIYEGLEGGDRSSIRCDETLKYSSMPSNRSPPPLPLGRLAETLGKRSSQLLYRVYSMKAPRKVSIRFSSGLLVMAAVIDDGTSVQTLEVSQSLVERMTGFGTDSEDFRLDLDNGCPRMRTALRGIHGFVTLGDIPGTNGIGTVQLSSISTEGTSRVVSSIFRVR